MQVKEISGKKAKHQAAQTSLLSFKDFNQTGQRSRETVAVFEALKLNQPLTRRGLHQVTGIAITNLCRVLYDATNCPDPGIKVCYVQPCIITNKKVRYYSLVDYVPTAVELKID